MTKLLGANWRTSVSGLVTVAATVVVSQPTLISFLPDALENWVRGIAGLIAAVSAAYFALNAKDKNVTGGTVQQTADGSVAHENAPSAAVEDTKSAWAGLGVIVAAAIMLAGCENMTPEQMAAAGQATAEVASAVGDVTHRGLQDYKEVVAIKRLQDDAPRAKAKKLVGAIDHNRPGGSGEPPLPGKAKIKKQ